LVEVGVVYCESCADVCVFGFNNSGSFVNDSFVSVGGTHRFANVTKTITSTLNTYICGQFYINDSANNQINSALSCFTVKDPGNNSVPTQPTIITPTNNTFISEKNVSLNFSSIDADGEAITYYHFINDTLNYTTIDGNASLNASDAAYTYNVYASDGVNNSANSTTIYFTKDSLLPYITFGQNTEANATNYSRNWIYINVTVTELNEVNITFAIHNNTALITSEVLTDNTRTKNFTNLNDSTYFYNVTLTDSANNRNTTETRQILLDTKPPQLANITVVQVTNNSAVITWNTNENANSTLNYDLTKNYSITTQNMTNTTTHLIAISNLNESTTYNYYISSTDLLGQTNHSNNLTFTTATKTEFTTDFTANTQNKINASTSLITTVLEITSSTTLTDQSINVTASKQTPTNKTINVTELRYVDITVTDTLTSDVTSFILTIYYNDTELDDLNISEKSLAMYRYNSSTNAWERLNSSTNLVLNVTLNTTLNYIRANLTNFSSYAAGGLLENGGICTTNNQCNSNNCADDFARTTNFCAETSGCANAGVNYSNGGAVCDGNNLQTCSTGTWSKTVCTAGCGAGACLLATRTTTTTTSGGGGGGGGGGSSAAVAELEEQIVALAESLTGIAIDTQEISEEVVVGGVATVTLMLKNNGEFCFGGCCEG